MTTPRNHPEPTDLYQLCPEATSKGGTGLADTLGTTLGGFMTMISAMFPQILARWRAPQNLCPHPPGGSGRIRRAAWP